MSLLKVENLSVSINSQIILDNISLDVEKGEITAITGESGSGKSMTAFAVMQLLPNGSFQNGKILLSGLNLPYLTETELCKIRGSQIGMVFQEPMTALNPLKTIGNQVAETVKLHRSVTYFEALEVAKATLNRVELPPENFPLSLYPYQLSGGQRQRVVIAMAIASNPKLGRADEPTTALDVTTQAQILKLLQDLVDDLNMGMIMITHDLAVVNNMANYISIMHKGKIVEKGPAKKIFTEMKHPYTKMLFNASNHKVKLPKQNTNNPLLEVKNLSRDYVLPRTKFFSKPKIVRAVNNVSFTLNKGERLGLVGESGCGKSTLTRALLGLEEIQEGEIRVSGGVVSKNNETSFASKKNMQVVFQDPFGSFNPRHKVSKLISEPLFLDKKIMKKEDLNDLLINTLISVGLSADDRNKYIHEFSGGQRQRIAIARALIVKPEIIIFDEAVSALDVSVRAQILDLLAYLCKTLNLTYIFISHDLSVVRTITDKVMVMKNGEIIESGKTENILTNPKHNYTKKLIEAAPSLPSFC